MKQKMRALQRKLEVETYAKDINVRFNWDDQPFSVVAVPVPVMYRLYHLGRAYDLNELKNLHPANNTTTDFVSVQLLTLELEQIREMIDDPVIHHYTAPLLAYLKGHRANTQARLGFYGIP